VHLREAASLAGAGYPTSLVAVEHDVIVPDTGVALHLLRSRTRASRMILGTLLAVAVALRTRPKVVHLHDPELIWSIPLLRLLGRTVIYDAHEDLPAQILDKPYLSRGSRRLVYPFGRLLVWIAGRTSSAVVAATEKIADTFPRAKTVVVHNYPRLDVADGTADELASRETFVGYVGGISVERGAHQMVDACATAAWPHGWRLALAGSVVPASLREELGVRRGWQVVDFHGLVGPIEARRLLTTCRVGLLVLQRNAAHLDSLPTKMFEYFAAGIPVIASDFPLWRSIIEAHDCGLLVDETSPDAIAEAVARYDREPDLDLYDRLLSGTRSRG
jgi:glycosyltransferase involved in cell wall biosynthesis